MGKFAILSMISHCVKIEGIFTKLGAAAAAHIAEKEESLHA